MTIGTATLHSDEPAQQDLLGREPLSREIAIRAATAKLHINTSANAK